LVIACTIGLFTRYLLLVVYPQNGLWVLGGLAICRLPEFALGMALALWSIRAPARVEWFLLRGPGFFLGLALYPGALWLYHGLDRYVFVDLATGTCCFLEIAGVAGLIARFGGPAQIFALIGAYSYGLYLVHQPYVICLGLRIRPLSIPVFLGVSIVTIAVLSVWGILLEKSVNLFVGKLAQLNRRRRQNVHE
jgi:peptidoglycan/LPS O-acetylase OafA/YrhL